MSVISGRCENEAVNDTLPPMRLQPQIIRCCVIVSSLLTHHRINALFRLTHVHCVYHENFGTSALSHVSPTYPVADRCVLSAPIAW